MLVADTVLQKRYKVIRAVGHGGMGAVYLAKDLRLGSVVALKENFFSDEKMIKAFEHEARLLASLRHVALPKVFDHFSIGEGQFLVMEYIYGDDFVEMLEKRKKLIEPVGQPKPFEVHEVIPWAEQLLDALDYIHTQQYPIIHRDIKPQNLKLARRNQIILLDFGLAKGNSGQTFIKSTSGSVIGYTPNYAPIEQIQGVGTDPRTDLYSLGATFYHLLTGHPPIASTIRAEAFLGGEPDPLRPPRMFNAKIPPGLSDLIMNALQQHRSNRPPSAAEMLKMLRSVTHPVGGTFETTQKIRDYSTTVMEAVKSDEPQQEKARQEAAEAERLKQLELEEQARRAREEADAQRQKLEERLRRAKEEAERQRQVEEEARKAREEAQRRLQIEAEARKAREEAENLERDLEEQTRQAIEELERRRSFEEQMRKSREDSEQRKLQEELIRKAKIAEAQKREQEEHAQRLRQEEAARQQYREEQARKAREEEQQKQQAAEQARKAQEEAERLRRELEEQARKAQEEAQRRKLHEEEARKAREEAQRLKQLEQQRQAQEEAERRRLQEELERRMQGEAQMQKALQDWEQMARQEAERKRLLEEEMLRATEEAQRLKQLLEEQTQRATQEAQKRQALEEQAQLAAQEAQKRKLLEEQARQATEEADRLRQQEQQRKVREDSEKQKLEEERARISREENQRLQQLEKQALLAAQESERFKQQLEEQSRRAELEAEKRRQLEEEVRDAERRLLEEQERNAEIERSERVTQVMGHTRELVAWDGVKEGKAYPRPEKATFFLQDSEPSVPPINPDPVRLIHSLEDDEVEKPNRNKWLIAAGVVVLLVIIMIIRIASPTAKAPPSPPPDPAFASLISADSYVQIQPGSFIMGSNTGEIDEKPAHKVALTKGFEMGKYEVTQEQWQAIMGDNPSKLRGANLPVDNISWNDIKNFIEKLNKRDTTRTYRLPFEAEWEYACRAGTEGEYPVKLDAVAWYQKNSDNLTHPVGQKQPNAWGLYDMMGNAFEYCQDWYLQNYYSYYADSVNPMGPPSGTLCPIRGGNYGTPLENCRPARRWNADPREKFTGAGFRLVRLPR